MTKQSKCVESSAKIIKFIIKKSFRKEKKSIFQSNNKGASYKKMSSSLFMQKNVQKCLLILSVNIPMGLIPVIES